MNKSLLITVAQLNARLGDVNCNVEQLLKAREKVANNRIGVIVAPEMYLSGYPCDDLVLRNDFMCEVAVGVDQLAKVTIDGGPAIIFGAPHSENGNIFNSVFVAHGGQIIARRDKVNLPNYGVFDDKRNFTPGRFKISNVAWDPVGLPICEDIWLPDVAGTYRIWS